MASEEPALWAELVPASCLLRSSHDSALGGVCFSHPASLSGIADMPLLAVDMALPPGEEPVCEIWHGNEPLTSGRHDAIRYRRGKTLLFGHASLDETAVDARGARTPLQAATETAYRSILDLLETCGHYSVLRFWNYFPAINQESHGMERYRQFNIGRRDAFLARGHPVLGSVPAASALGSAGGGLRIAFLAARASVAHVENPRQISAYHYPEQYGPSSPTFSRATLVRLGGRDMLFISGTASIVGHQTLHRGKAAAQTRESLENIAAVVTEANRRAPGAGFRLDALAYKVYVRHPEHLDSVRKEMARFIGAPVTAVFLQADICRADLLVEIEAGPGNMAAGMPDGAAA